MTTTGTITPRPISSSDDAVPLTQEAAFYRYAQSQFDNMQNVLSEELGSFRQDLTESLRSGQHNGSSDGENRMTTTHLGFSDRFQIIAAIIATGAAILALMYAYADAKFEAQESKMDAAIVAVESVGKDIRRDMDVFRAEMVGMRKDINHEAEINQLKMQILEEKIDKKNP